MPTRLLIAQNDEIRLDSALRDLQVAGFEVRAVSSGPEVLAQLATFHPELVLVSPDLSLSDRESALARLTSIPGGPLVLAWGESNDLNAAVTSMRMGALDYVLNSATGEELEMSVRRALESRIADETDSPKLAHNGILGSSPALLRIQEQIQRVAATPNTTVLISGESGVGKELVARAVHENSSRRDGPFVALNCAALTDSLLEAELFGYEAGAFTGAVRGGRDGLLAAAQGGTLLLDEIGELAPELQAKLLRVLQERVYRRVGGSSDLKFDVRVIASTNRDLEQFVADGHFRADLYYRLNVLLLAMPPLRERIEDIPALATHFLAEFAREMNRPLEGFSPAAMEALRNHTWPGNVRELRNSIERAALLSSGNTVGARELRLEHSKVPPASPELNAQPPAALPEPTDMSLRSLEASHIRRVLMDVGGNRSRAARLLGVNRTTLYNKLRRYEIDQAG